MANGSLISNGLNLTSIIRELEGIVRQLAIESEKALYKLRLISSISRQVYTARSYHKSHGRKVCRYALSIGLKKGLMTDRLISLQAAALLHDFGKVAISNDIFVKKQPLTTKERIAVQMHVIKGYHLLSEIKGIEQILEGVRTHHEYYNGRGYPFCLCGKSIPLLGRILAVADAYDAMTTERPYRKTKTKKQAFEELRKCSGKQFDPEIVKAFMETLK
ncbi:MAG: HD domain-containing phosphohydrolase [bacterium]